MNPRHCVRRRLTRAALVLGSAVLPLGALSVLDTPPPAAATTALPVGNFTTGLATELFSPTAMPPGSDNWSCRPSRTHPYPVVLVHGTLANEAFSWQALSPMLVNAGYCVYAFNYGATSATLEHFYGLADIAQSAQQLEVFVNQVLASTGASQIDLVGHSQGGMMPRYYIDFLGGAPKVHTLVGLAPSNHGTTIDGLTTLAEDLDTLGITNGLFNVLSAPSVPEQEQGSAFLAHLNAGGDTVPGPRYVVIESRYDEVVTPYQSAFLNGPNVQNILLQAQCPIDFTEHLGIIYDPVALQDVMNALGADSAWFHPACSLVLPVVGG